MTGDWTARAGRRFVTRKRPAMGTRGMVVTNHPLASAAGAEMLAEGGNAFDGAIAALFALSVVEPMMVGLLGGGTAHLRLADGTQTVIDGKARCAAAAAPDLAKDPTIAAIYLPGGAPLKAGHRVVQGDYAQTLKAIAREGAAAIDGALGDAAAAGFAARASSRAKAAPGRLGRMARVLSGAVPGGQCRGAFMKQIRLSLVDANSRPAAPGAPAAPAPHPRA